MASRPSDPRSKMHAKADHLDNVEATDTVHHKKKKDMETGVRQLNITSMLDVCFQLLIFFILTANFAIDEGVLAADMPQGVPPEPTQVQEPPKDPIIIVLRSVGEDCGIWIENGRSIPNGDFQELFKILNGWRYDASENPGGRFESDNPIVIKPMPNVEWGHVVSAFNAVVRAKYSAVSFAQAG